MVFQSFKHLWKSWGLYGTFAIVVLIMWNTNVLFQIVKKEERVKMELVDKTSHMMEKLAQMGGLECGKCHY